MIVLHFHKNQKYCQYFYFYFFKTINVWLHKKLMTNQFICYTNMSNGSIIDQQKIIMRNRNDFVFSI